MKDGSIVNVHLRTNISVENGAPGNTVFSCNYIAQAPIVFDEADHIELGGETVIQMPSVHGTE